MEEIAFTKRCLRRQWVGPRVRYLVTKTRAQVVEKYKLEALLWRRSRVRSFGS